MVCSEEREACRIGRGGYVVKKGRHVVNAGGGASRSRGLLCSNK